MKKVFAFVFLLVMGGCGAKFQGSATQADGAGLTNLAQSGVLATPMGASMRQAYLEDIQSTLNTLTLKQASGTSCSLAQRSTNDTQADTMQNGQSINHAFDVIESNLMACAANMSADALTDIRVQLAGIQTPRQSPICDADTDCGSTCEGVQSTLLSGTEGMLALQRAQGFVNAVRDQLDIRRLTKFPTVDISISCVPAPAHLSCKNNICRPG